MAKASPAFVELSDTGIAAYRSRFIALLRSDVHDLTLAERADVLPPRGPSGCQQNQLRGVVIRALNAGGYTCQGRRL